MAPFLPVHSRDRTYYLRWGLLVAGITGWAVGATLLDAALRPAVPAGPPHPPVAVVVPANPILSAPPIDLSATLSLPADSSRAVAADSASAFAYGLWNGLDGVGRPAAPGQRPDASGTQAAEAPSSVGFPTTYAGQLRLYRTLQRKPGADATLDLGGLVVDETLTPHGRIFYADFFDVWESPAVEGFYTVRVQEQPTPGRGTLVEVFVNDDVTFRTRLHPQTQIDEQALQAARRTYAYVRSGRGILRIR